MISGLNDTIVLIPGWATDCRIFKAVESSKIFKEKPADKISLLGWSLGGFMAAEFASKHPDTIDELILVSIRTKYDPAGLADIKQLLMKDKKAYLYKFYLESFSKEDKEGLAWFKKNLLKSYLQDTKTEDLIRGLDYLSQASIDPERLRQVEKIRIFHGTEDTIAPLGEAEEIGLRLPQAEFIKITGAGHCPFLNRDFRDTFYNG
jgi:pimeloyl-[acyl-carrier protein] methyl ester esterase